MMIVLLIWFSEKPKTNWWWLISGPRIVLAVFLSNRIFLVILTYGDDVIFSKIDVEKTSEIAEMYGVVSRPEYVLIKRREVIAHLKADQAMELPDLIKKYM